MQDQPFSVVFWRFAEKVGWTYVQALLAFVIVGLNDQSPLNVDFGTKAAIAAIPAALTAFVALVPAERDSWNVWVATFYRAGRTFAASFVGVLLAGSAVSGFNLDGQLWLAAAVSALPAAIAVVKATVAMKVGNTGTVALLPQHLDLRPPLDVVVPEAA